jgi:hypothetical protein
LGPPCRCAKPPDPLRADEIPARRDNETLPPCILQNQAQPWRHTSYRMGNFDPNWADISLGQRGIVPAVRVTIAGPDGLLMIAAVPQSPAGNTIACRPIVSFDEQRSRSFETH